MKPQRNKMATTKTLPIRDFDHGNTICARAAKVDNLYDQEDISTMLFSKNNLNTLLMLISTSMITLT